MASETVSSDGEITVTIDCRTHPGRFHFEVSPQLEIREFLHRVLTRLSEGENGDEVKNMQNYYEPVLELCAGQATLPLDSQLTLGEAGVEDKAVCRISAKPRKERIMFCNNG